VPGSPTCIRNAGEFKWPIILGIAIFGGGSGGWCMASWLLRVLENNWLRSPLVEDGLFQACINGECGSGEIVKFGLRG
jgi:hypothetical protein